MLRLLSKLAFIYCLYTLKPRMSLPVLLYLPDPDAAPAHDPAHCTEDAIVRNLDVVEVDVSAVTPLQRSPTAVCSNCNARLVACAGEVFEEVCG